jgi:flagellar biosynthesis/type III secretory pathway protein FliH
LHRPSLEMPSILKPALRARNLVPRECLEAEARARELVAAAEAATARLRASAEAERAAVLEEASRAGREEGLALAAAALAEVGVARADRLRELERELAAAGLEVARAVLGCELTARPELVLELARRALEPVRSRREVLLRVNPADVALLQGGRSRLAELLDRAPALSLRADPGVARGGVVVETEVGRVDGRVEAQLAALERLLAEGER